MADHQPRREPTQKTRPRGTNPATGKPYEPATIPVPKRSAFDKLVRRAAKGKAHPRQSS